MNNTKIVGVPKKIAVTVKYQSGGFSVAERNIKQNMFFITTDGHQTGYHRTDAPLSPSNPLLPLLEHEHTVPVQVSRVEVSVGGHRHTLQHQQVSKPLLKNKVTCCFPPMYDSPHS